MVEFSLNYKDSCFSIKTRNYKNGSLFNFYKIFILEYRKFNRISKYIIELRDNKY